MNLSWQIKLRASTTNFSIPRPEDQSAKLDMMLLIPKSKTESAEAACSLGRLIPFFSLSLSSWRTGKWVDVR